MYPVIQLGLAKVDCN